MSKMEEYDDFNSLGCKPDFSPNYSPRMANV